MGSRIRLVYQGLVLDLNDGATYTVEAGFIPPAVQKSVNYAQGSIINQRGGTRIQSKALDRAWSFTVIVSGASLQETHLAARQIQNFLNQAADTRNKLYLEYYPSDAIPYKPAWGQLGYYYQVKDGTVETWDEYAAWSADHVIKCTLNLTIAPFAEGIRQLLATAIGGIFEDTIGTADGESRGLAMSEATTNLSTNPIFGYYTYDNGWTTGSDLTAVRNVDRRFVLFGPASAKLLRKGGTNIRFYQSINVGNTNTWTISFYAKKPDGSAVTASDITVYYASSQTTTFQAVGEGYYRCYASVTGIASAQNTGVQLNLLGGIIYIDGFQVEEKAYPTQICHGDLLGCAWSGTAHSSSSSRTAPYLTLDIIPAQEYQMSVRAVVKWQHGYTFGTDRYIFYGDLRAYFRASDDKIVLADASANVIATAAQSFAAGTIQVLHFVMDKGAAKIYINGVEAATGSGLLATGATTTLYLGRDNGTTHHGNLTLLDFTMWEEPLSATQVGNDTADVTQQVNADTYGKNLNKIPWMHGPKTLNHYYDAGGNQDWETVGGIPGSGPAKSILRFSAGPAAKAWVISNLVSDIPIRLGPLTFLDLSGTVVAGALGGEAQRTSINTTGAYLTSLEIKYDHEIKRFAGKKAYIMAVLADAGSGLMCRLATYFNGTAPFAYSDFITLAADATLRHFLIGPISLPEFPADHDWLFVEGSSLFFELHLKRSSGTANVDLDYYQALVGDLTYIIGNNTTAGGLVIDSDWNVWEYANVGSQIIARSKYQGSQFQLWPGMYNYLVMLESLIGGANTIADTLPIHSMYVTPVYDLL